MVGSTTKGVRRNLLGRHGKAITSLRRKFHNDASKGDGKETRQPLCASADRPDYDDPPLSVPRAEDIESTDWDIRDHEDGNEKDDAAFVDFVSARQEKRSQQDMEFAAKGGDSDPNSPYSIGGRFFRPRVVFAENAEELREEIRAYEDIPEFHVPSLTELSLRAAMHGSGIDIEPDGKDEVEVSKWLKNVQELCKLPDGMVEAVENTHKEGKTIVDIMFALDQALLEHLVDSKLGRHLSRLKAYNTRWNDENKDEAPISFENELLPKLETLQLYKQGSMRDISFDWSRTPSLREICIQQRPLPTCGTISRFHVNLPDLRVLRVECFDLVSLAPSLVLSLALCPNLEDVVFENVRGVVELANLGVLVLPSCEHLSLRFSDVKRAELWAPRLLELDLESTPIEYMAMNDEPPMSLEMDGYVHDLSSLAQSHPQLIPLSNYSVNLENTTEAAIGGNILTSSRCKGF